MLTQDEIDRYKRHINLEGVGIEGQLRFKKSSVLFVGAGGLASPALLYLAAAGIGIIGIIDNDKVEKSNLQRQVIHDNGEIGNYKTESAKKRIQKINPNCNIITFSERLSAKNALIIIKEFDIVCDCSDNFGTRFLTNDACVILKKPFIYGSVQGFEGQASVFNLKENSPNFRDLIPNNSRVNDIPSCNEFGVIGVSPGLIGILQANEIIKIILQKGNTLDGKLLVFNLLNMTMKKLNLCANYKNKAIYDLEMYSHDYENEECQSQKINTKKISSVNFKKICKQNSNDIIVIDVREKEEYDKSALKGSISIPLSSLNKKSSFKFIKENSSNKVIYLICQKGIRSERASQILIQNQIEAISIEGGLDQFELI
tara:strand:+ start:902 stop:2014 length:1113 start_codon:yes stop_codon:yes gene_type:complete